MGALKDPLLGCPNVCSIPVSGGRAFNRYRWVCLWVVLR